MINEELAKHEELAKQFLKELEKEYNCPLQIRIDTLDTEDCSFGKCERYYGHFNERLVVVKRVESLEIKYLDNIKLIEGEYLDLLSLKAKINGLNIVYGDPIYNQKAWHLVKERLGDKEFFGTIAANFELTRKIKVTPKKVYKILDDGGFKYFKHNIVCEQDGIYDNGTSKCGSFNVVDRTKIADITLKLIE